MLSLRSRLLSAFALVLGAVLVVTVFTVPAHAAITRTLSISISPTAVNAGAPVSFSGRLTKSPAGSTVKIQRKVGTRWVSVTSTRTTSSYGGYRVKVTMPSTPGTYQFRSIAGASRTLSAATSKTVTATALRKVIVKLASNKTSIALGEAIELSGKAWPFRSGNVATIQRFNGIKWTTLVTTTISSTGTFKRLLRPGASTTYRAVVSRTGLLATGVSAAVTVEIPTGPAAPVITTTTLDDAATEKPYTETLEVDGEAGAWAVTSGQLPPGLSLSSSTGAITGTPTTGGTFPFTVTFSETETLLSDSQALSILVRVSPRITTTSLPAATGFVTYTPFTLQKTGNAGTWSIDTGSLPPGMSFNTATGEISGKPTIKTAGDYAVRFRFTETAAPNLSVSKSLTLRVNAAPDPVITTTSLPAATGFVTYTPFTLQKTGNAGTWSIDTGSLPPGMSFDTATGEISGKPTIKDAADYGVTFRFTETESTTFATKFLTLHVNAAAKPVISTTSLPFGVVTRDYDAPALAVSTPRPGTWSIASGSLPPGVTLNSDTGVLSGAPSEAGTFAVTVRFTETESGTTDTQALSILVYSLPEVTTTALPDALEDSTGSPFNTTLTSTGGSTSKTWSRVGTLPPGLTLTSAGKISGTATTSGDYTFTVIVTDGVTGETDSQELTIHVGPVAIFTATTPPGSVGDAYSLQFDGRPYNLFYVGWSVNSGLLPPGLTLNSTGRLSGTPTLPGDYTFTIEYEVLLSGTRLRQYTLHVDP